MPTASLDAGMIRLLDQSPPRSVRLPSTSNARALPQRGEPWPSESDAAASNRPTKSRTSSWASKLSQAAQRKRAQPAGSTDHRVTAVPAASAPGHSTAPCAVRSKPSGSQSGMNRIAAVASRGRGSDTPREVGTRSPALRRTSRATLRQCGAGIAPPSARGRAPGRWSVRCGRRRAARTVHRREVYEEVVLGKEVGPPRTDPNAAGLQAVADSLPRLGVPSLKCDRLAERLGAGDRQHARLRKAANLWPGLRLERLLDVFLEQLWTRPWCSAAVQQRRLVQLATVATAQMGGRAEGRDDDREGATAHEDGGHHGVAGSDCSRRCSGYFAVALSRSQAPPGYPVPSALRQAPAEAAARVTARQTRARSRSRRASRCSLP